MMARNLLLCFILVPCLVNCSLAGEPSFEGRMINDSSDYYNREFIRYENYVYSPNIRTVQCHQLGVVLSPAIVRLNSEDVLLLSFDDLEADVKTYQYRMIHCSFDWKPSNLFESQYQHGYSSYPISDWQFSFNVIHRFTHYQLKFPNNEIKPAISGNYLLIIFQDDQKDQPVITRRFMVVDQKVGIETNVHQATVIDDRRSKQEVDFSILKNGYNIENAFDDLKVAIYQNDRTDNVITNLKPLFLNGNNLEYDYEEGNVFNGGNEFRYFDMRSLRTPSERIRQIISESDTVHVFLMDDLKRSSNRYSSASDINGAYVIKTYDGTTDQIESDYCLVHFRLPIQTPFSEGNLYVFGSFTDWSFNKQTRMIYNANNQSYECVLFLKQGYYNYEYVLMEDGSGLANETEIEGNHWETENTYMICVYNKASNKNYDELIGVKRVSTFTH